MSSPPPKRPRTDANTNGNNISDAKKQEEETMSNDGGDSVGSKKINLLDTTNNIAVINPSILHQSSESELANSYANATPYPHGMIHNFCKDGFLGE